MVCLRLVGHAAQRTFAHDAHGERTLLFASRHPSDRLHDGYFGPSALVDRRPGIQTQHLLAHRPPATGRRSAICLPPHPPAAHRLPTTEGSRRRTGPRYDTHELAPFLAATIPLDAQPHVRRRTALRVLSPARRRANRLLPPRLAPSRASRSTGRSHAAAGCGPPTTLHHAVHPQSPLVEHQLSPPTSGWRRPDARRRSIPIMRRSATSPKRPAGGSTSRPRPITSACTAYWSTTRRSRVWSTTVTNWNSTSIRATAKPTAWSSWSLTPVGNSTDGSATRWEIGASIRRPQRRTALPPLRSTGGTTSLAASYMPGERWELSTASSTLRAAPYTPTRDPPHRRRFVRPRTRLLQRRPPAGLPPARPVGHLLAAAETVAQRHQSLPLQPLRPPQTRSHLVAGARRRREARIPDPSAPALPLHRHPLRKLDFQILERTVKRSVIHCLRCWAAAWARSRPIRNTIVSW